MTRVAEDDVEALGGFEHGLQNGDILVASWGYDQTNVDFYEVTGVTGTIVVLREIEGKVVRSEQTADYLVPVPGDFAGPPLRRRPSGSAGSPRVRINGAQTAYKWGGEPMYQTGVGYGH